MKYLFEITTGEVGESYIRAYVWAENEDQAMNLLEQVNPNIEVLTVNVERLFSEDSACFATKLSDSGFEVGYKTPDK